MILNDLPAEVLAMVAACLADEATPLTIRTRRVFPHSGSLCTAYEEFKYPKSMIPGRQDERNPASVSRLGLLMLSDTLCKEYEYLIYHKSLVVFEDPTALMLYYDEEHFLGKPALMQKKCSVQRIELEHLRISYDAAPYAKGLHQLRELKALYINCGLRDLNIEAVIAVAAPLAQNRPDVLSMIYVNVNEPEKIRYRGRMRRDKHAVSEPRHKVWRALSETHKGSMVQLELEKFLRKKAGWDKVNATRKAKKERKQRAVEAMIAGKQAKRAARKAAKDGGMRTKEDHHMDQESG